MTAVSIDSAEDPRLADYAGLTDVSLRTSLEAVHGLFIAEGTKVIARAVAAGYPVRSLLLAESRRGDLPSLLGPGAQASETPQEQGRLAPQAPEALQEQGRLAPEAPQGQGRLAPEVPQGQGRLAPEVPQGQGRLAPEALQGQGRLALEASQGQGCLAAEVPVYVVPDEVAERLTGFRVHRGALASMERKPLPGVAEVIAGARRIVVLEDLVDHGNVGAIFRCAAALGVDAVVLSPRCADPLYRRAVKVSMGAVFAIRYGRMTDWFGGLAGLRDAGFRMLALTPDENAAPVGTALGPAGSRVALLLGTEGDGLSSRWLSEADEAVRIPMDPGARAAGVDSLNVVAAAAIACHMLAGNSS